MTKMENGFDSASKAELERLREALQTIDDLLTGEIKVRFGTSDHFTEAEVAGDSVIYSLLVVPRNIARKALTDD